MNHKVFLLLVILIPMNSCAKGVATQAGCERFQFEDKTVVHVQPDFVKALNTRLEVGAPQHIISMTLNAEEITTLENVTEVLLSAFFRPLENESVECQKLTGKAQYRCYAQLPSSPLQLSVMFGQGDQSGFPSQIREIASAVEKTALNCNSGE